MEPWVDYTDVMNALNGIRLSGFTTSFTGMETTMNGQSATVQQQIQLMTNTESKLEGMEDNFYSSFKDVETTMNHNLRKIRNSYVRYSIRFPAATAPQTTSGPVHKGTNSLYSDISSVLAIIDDFLHTLSRWD